MWRPIAIINGGPGSGNFGHAGRPSQVGGSASSGGSKAGAKKVSGSKAPMPPSGGSDSRFLTLEEAKEVGEELWDRSIGDNKLLRKGIRLYTGVDYDAVNSIIREDGIEKAPKSIQTLNEAAKAPLSTTVFRGISPKLHASHFANRKPGDVIEAQGLQSTSLRFDAAVSFARPDNKDVRTMLQINTKTGLYVAGLNENEMEHEEEVIQAHKTRYQYVRDETIMRYGFKHRVIHLEEVES